MPQDYYDDEGDNPGSTGSASGSSDNEGSEPQSALVPKSFFAGKEGLEVGDVERVKVLRIMDDEVEIECIKEGYDKEEPKEETQMPEEAGMME